MASTKIRGDLEFFDGREKKTLLNSLKEKQDKIFMHTVNLFCVGEQKYSSAHLFVSILSSYEDPVSSVDQLFNLIAEPLTNASATFLSNGYVYDGSQYSQVSYAGFHRFRANISLDEILVGHWLNAQMREVYILKGEIEVRSDSVFNVR